MRCAYREFCAWSLNRIIVPVKIGHKFVGFLQSERDNVHSLPLVLRRRNAWTSAGSKRSLPRPPGILIAGIHPIRTHFCNVGNVTFNILATSVESRSTSKV